MEEPLFELVNNGRIIATTENNKIRDCSIIISAIGTSIKKDGSPNLESLDELLNLIAPHFPKYGLLILKTTLPIGMTEIIAHKLSEITGFTLDQELFVSFSPERIVEGKAMEELRTLPKIIGGIGPNSTIRTKEVIEKLGGEVVIVENTRTAEMCKLLDNSYRMTRFGFAADVAAVAIENGINAYAAINAANKGYVRNNIPLPSVGVSGYCLTKDPYYLDAAAPHIWENRGFPSTWLSARLAADLQTESAFNRVSIYFDNDLKGKLIVIGGITYKENIDDTRLSHGRILLEMFKKAGAEILIWDSVTTENVIEGIPVHNNHMVLNEADCLVITVPHDNFKLWQQNLEGVELMNNKLIFDGWGIVQNSNKKEMYLMGTGI